MSTAESRERLRREAEAADGSFTEAIKLKPGEMLSGVLIRYAEKSHPSYGPAYGLVLAEEGEKPRTLWAYQAALRREIEKFAPRPGEYVVVKRYQDSDKGFGRWTLLVDREGESGIPDFSKFAKPSKGASPPSSGAGESAPDDEQPF